MKELGKRILTSLKQLISTCLHLSQQQRPSQTSAVVMISGETGNSFQFQNGIVIAKAHLKGLKAVISLPRQKLSLFPNQLI